MDKEKETEKETENETEKETATENEKSAAEIALEETLNEIKKQNEELAKTVKDLQIANKKMALQIGKETPTDKDLFKGFSKYDR